MFRPFGRKFVHNRKAVAAIPAVIAYNRYADQVSRIEVRYDTFVEELSSILSRHGSAPVKGAPAAEARA